MADYRFRVETVQHNDEVTVTTGDRGVGNFDRVDEVWTEALARLRRAARQKRCGSVVISVHVNGEGCDHE